jgi:hypothetical protein
LQIGLNVNEVEITPEGFLRYYKCLFLLLYLQMDRLNGLEIINPDILQKGKQYFIQQAQKFVTNDEVEIFIRIRLQQGHDVMIHLPQNLTYVFNDDRLSVLNNPRYVYCLVYYGRTFSGTPIFDFEYTGGFPDSVGN